MLHFFRLKTQHEISAQQSFRHPGGGVYAALLNDLRGKITSKGDCIALRVWFAPSPFIVSRVFPPRLIEIFPSNAPTRRGFPWRGWWLRVPVFSSFQTTGKKETERSYLADPVNLFLGEHRERNGIAFVVSLVVVRGRETCTESRGCNFYSFSKASLIPDSLQRDSDGFPCVRTRSRRIFCYIAFECLVVAVLFRLPKLFRELSWYKEARRRS